MESDEQNKATESTEGHLLYINIHVIMIILFSQSFSVENITYQQKTKTNHAFVRLSRLSAFGSQLQLHWFLLKT